MKTTQKVGQAIVGGLVAAVAVVLAAPSAGIAQTAVQERLDALEKKVAEQQKTLTEKLGFELHAFVATNYNYNFNNPDSKANKIHVFDEDANSIELDQANINLQRNVPEGLGFNLDLDFGKTAEVVGRATHWSNNQNNTESNNSIELRQAYLKYAFGDSGFSLMAGKFVTFHGAEVIKAYNNFNYNISNSILFGFAIPFTHTGIIGTYTLPSDLGSIAAGVVNGWDNPVDNNSGKSVHTMLTLTPHPMFTFNLSGTYGPEQTDSGRSKRLMITPLITIKPMDMLTLILDYNYGNESNIALENGAVVTRFANGNFVPGNAMWQGMAGYVVVAATDKLQVSLRGEVFDDPDGVRTGFQQVDYTGRRAAGPGATFWEITPTIAYKITDGLTWRSEYRHDEADKFFFDKNNQVNGNPGTNGARSQDLITTELIYAF